VACADEPASDPAPDLPPGLLLVGDRAALGQVAALLGRLEGTPLAREAAELHQRVAGCERFEILQPEDEELAGEARCEGDTTELALLHGIAREHALAFALPASDQGRAIGWVEVDPDGTVRAEARLEGLPTDPPWSGLVPSEDPPGPAVLSADDALFHGRIRPRGGLALAEAIEEGSEFDKLFKLRGELFQGAVLDGSLEVAVWPPEPGARMFPFAIAMGVTVRRLAVFGMEAMVEELMADWPVHRSDFTIGEHEGACLLDMNFVPEFAPCYVATPDALIIGWNQGSLRRGLEGPPPTLPPSGGLELRLDRFDEADLILARTAGLEGKVEPVDWPWAAARFEIVQVQGRPTYRLDLQGAP
jgi:hypothetical protein